MIGTVVDLVRRGNIEFISGEKRDKIVSFQIPIKTQTHHSHVNWRWLREVVKMIYLMINICSNLVDF